ncbi:MAG TPA: hypothetical protein DCZ75_08845 [Geobacter sp.]|nr:hypothetical protein [Geobacter sp.]
MKSKFVMLLAAALMAVAAPVMAADGGQHSATHKMNDAQCERECNLLLKDCAQEVDSIQDRIRKLQTAINEKGATTYTRDELKLLNKKLQEANETLRVLNKH